MKKLYHKSNGSPVYLTVEMIINQNKREIEHHQYILANRTLPTGRVKSIQRHIEHCKQQLHNHLNDGYINNKYYIVEETA